MPVRKVLRKFHNNSLNRMDKYLSHTATHPRSSRSETPLIDFPQRVQLLPENRQPGNSPITSQSQNGPITSDPHLPVNSANTPLKRRHAVCRRDLNPTDEFDSDTNNSNNSPQEEEQEDSITLTRFLNGSTVISQPFPLSFILERGPLTIRNPDPVPTTNSKTDDSDDSDDSDDFDEKNINKKACHNLAIIAPTVTITPPRSPDPPGTSILDYFPSPERLQTPPAEHLHASPAFLFRNTRRQGSKPTDPPTVVERSGPLTSHPDVLQFANISSAAIPSPTSSEKSLDFVDPSRCVPIRVNSLPSSLRIFIPGPVERVGARLALKRVEVEFFTDKLNKAKRELSEIQAPYSAKKNEVESLAEKFDGINRELSEVETPYAAKKDEVESLTKKLQHAKSELFKIEGM